MYLKRLAENDLSQALSGGKVILVLGARQVGKTTLVEQVVREEKTRFLNFDVEIDKAHFLAAASLAPIEAIR
ncbi:MAG: AAA family ATPase, partial [Candidatus Competibacteraceae bacterium]|nr:AAA family ATPase [Candidatus Competibacteraceae bacterium]